MVLSTIDPDTSFIPNTPSGPLDTYRNQVAFDWKRLRLVFEDINSVKIKVNIHKM